MRTQFITLLTLLVFAVAPVTHAQSIDMQQALERMNSIIAEMEKLRTEFSQLAGSVNQASANTPTPTVLGVQTGPVFTQSLDYGETNDDIKRIQKLLATDAEIYPYGVASGFFGPKTEEAIKNLQARNGWDTPGVIGPATKDLLERYFRAYPNENWPADVLKSQPPSSAAPTPEVQGASINVEQQLADALQSLADVQSNAGTSGTNPAKEINVEFDEGEALIEIKYTNGNRKGYIADTTDKDEVVSFIAGRTVMNEAQVREVIDYEGRSSRDDNDDDRDADEEDAEDALDDAEDALDDAEEAIEEAEDDGDDVDWAEDTLDDADEKFEEAEEAFDDEDYDEAVELAEEAEELAEKAEDRIDEEKGSSRGDVDEIDEIEVEVDDGESEVTVKYDDDDDYEFTVEEDDEDDLIEEIADELDIDEDDVEDLVEFDYGDIDRIEVRIDDDSSLVRIFYESDVERRLRLNETDEDDIIEEIADELDEDEDDIEDLTEF